MQDLWKRLAKPIVTGLLAIGAFAAHYATRWDFSPGDVDRPGNHLPLSVPDSPMLKSRDAAHSSWHVACVTNRDLSSGRIRTSDVDSRGSLLEQSHDGLNQVDLATFGFAEVRVERKRQRGQCEPSFVRVEKNLQTVGETQFLNSINTLLADAKEKNLLVFVHGFNVSHDMTLCRTAQLAEDLPFGGVVIAFDWASCAEMKDLAIHDRYAQDEVVAERYFWSLARLLARLKQTVPESTRLHVMAHSMGNRVTLRALNALVGYCTPTGRTAGVFPSDDTTCRFPLWRSWVTLERPPIEEIVFAAPDVDASEFQRLAGNVSHLCEGMTLYTSDVDVALESSYHMNQEGYRAGDSRASISVEGLRVVRTSRVSRLDPLGHSYYGSDPSVLDNLASLFQFDVDRIATMTVQEYTKSRRE